MTRTAVREMADLIACNECDLLHEVRPIPAGTAARCSRCGDLLYQKKRNSLERTLAMTAAALILFVLANVFPFLGLEEGGLMRETTLLSGVRELYHQDLWGVATLVLLTTVVLPLLEILGMLYVLAPLRFNRVPWQMPLVFRTVRVIRPWGMMEVFMVGILVSIAKLTKTADILPGVALYSFAALVLVLAASVATLDPQVVWDRAGTQR